MRIIIILLFALYYTSCIRESLPECPYQYNIQIFVKDKNYSNISAINMDTIDENLPFKQYVSNIYYTLQDINTGENIISPVLKTIVGNEKEVEFILDNIPDGEYLLTIWGNIETSGNSVEDPSFLHENKEEDSDEYMASEVLTIKTGLAQTKSIGLERIKGKLIVTYNNLSDDIFQIKEIVTSVYANVDNRRLYSLKTDVEKAFLKSNMSLNQTSTFLAPTIDNENSTLSLFLYGSDISTPLLTITPINIKIARNEITPIVINYNPSLGQLEIWVYIDNAWSLVLELDINDV